MGEPSEQAEVKNSRRSGAIPFWQHTVHAKANSSFVMMVKNNVTKVSIYVIIIGNFRPSRQDGQVQDSL